MKKTIYTLNVDNYSPAITDLTYPFMKRYAQKIGADFRIINKRAFPTMPVTYEKLQIYTLGKKDKNDWNIYFDSDALIHPDTVDFTSLINKDTVIHNGADMASIRWKYDHIFLRDGRDIGSCNWLAIASDWCLDLWSPLDIPFQQALNDIYPTADEKIKGITKEHLIDDYTLSRNIAKHGLKFTTALDLMRQKGIESASFFWHQYTLTEYEKMRRMKQVIRAWNLEKRTEYFEPIPYIRGWMELSELRWLYDNAQEMDSVLEIGCWKGKSTHALASGCKGKVHTIDSFKGAPEERDDGQQDVKIMDVKELFLENTKEFKNITLYAEDSNDAWKHFKPKSIDMVFIDGGHLKEQLEADLKHYRLIARKLLCGHDFKLMEGVLVNMGLHPVQEVEDIWSVEV